MTHSASSKVYVLLLEVSPLPGCSIDPAEFGGAAVRCYVEAASNDDAITRVRESLADNLFQLVEIEWCVDENSTQWENPDDETASELIAEARSCNEVVFGEFHVWPIDAEE